MSLPQLVLKNQFGEESINVVLSSTGGEVPAVEVATGTILANFSGSTDFPSAQTVQAVANKLPAKTGITAISALALDADLPTAVLKINAILAALKVVS